MQMTAVWNAIKTFDYRTIVDVLAVAWLIYRLLLLVKGTRAWQIIVGLMTLFAALFLSDFLHLYSLNWLLRQALPLGPVALVILFLPELRHALEEFGRPGFWGRSFGLVVKEDMSEMIEAVVAAVGTMSIKRIGALIVFERESGLEDIIATGTELHAEVTSDLIGTIFYKGTPLHDGAMVIRGSQIVAAGCTLPLTSSPRVEAAVHTRHKAALGMSEESDAVVVIVSEETGTISIAIEGKLLRGLREESLREKLRTFLNVGDILSPAERFVRVPIDRVGDAIKTARTTRKTARTSRKTTGTREK